MNSLPPRTNWKLATLRAPFFMLLARFLMIPMGPETAVTNGLSVLSSSFTILFCLGITHLAKRLSGEDEPKAEPCWRCWARASSVGIHLQRLIGSVPWRVKCTAFKLIHGPRI